MSSGPVHRGAALLLALSVEGLACGPAGAAPREPAALRAAAPFERKGAASVEPLRPHTGPPSDAERNAGIVWRFHAGAPLEGGPAVGPGGRIYVGSVEGYLHALDVSGTFLWSYTVEGGIVGTPITDNVGRVFVATTARRIYAILADGSRWWVFRSPVPIVTPLVRDGAGSLVFGGGDRHVWAVSERAGVRWRAALGGRYGARIASGPAVAGDEVLAITADGVQSVVRGALKRRDVRLHAPPTGQAVLLADGSSIVSAGGALHRMGRDGARLWEAPGLLDVFEVGRGTFVAASASRLVRLGTDGKVLESTALPSRPSASPLQLGGALLVPCEDGVLRVVRGGEVTKELPVSTAPLRAPAALASQVVVAGGDGVVVALEPSRLELR